MRRIIDIVLMLVALCFTIAALYTGELLAACAMGLFCLFHMINLALPIIEPIVIGDKKNNIEISRAIDWKETVSRWPFSLRVKILCAIIDLNSVYARTDNGDSEYLESKQITGNSQSGIIYINLEGLQ